MKDSYKLIILIILFIITLLMIRMYVNKKTGLNASEAIHGVVELTDESFDSFIKSADKNNKRVLVDFYATWCGPCQMLEPVIEEAASESSDVLYAKVDVDACPKLVARFGIRAMPTLVVIEDRQEINRQMGLVNKETLLDFINKSNK